jgi:ribosomal protein S18 acetylase RimI-like enzyme
VHDSIFTPQQSFNDSRIAQATAQAASASQRASSEQVQVRKVQAADLSEVSLLITESFHPDGDWLSWLSPLLRLGIHQDLYGRLTSGCPYYACLVGITSTDRQTKSWQTEILGTVEVAVRSVSAWGSCPQRSPYISNLAVRPDYRRQGVGQQLLLACERVVAVWGFRDLYLHVLESNQPARELYSKTGYHIRYADSFWSSTLFGQPRRLLLHKPLSHY